MTNDRSPAADPPSTGPGVVATVGHGRLGGHELARLVARAGVAELVDVRRTPFSRRNPQFNRDQLAAALAEAQVAYRWWEELGGRREAAANSPNVGVTPANLRGYADHLGTGEGLRALGELAQRGSEASLAILCAEHDWRRCHRRLLADALTVVGRLQVVHLDHHGRGFAHRPGDRVRDAGGVPRWDRGADRPLLA